MASDSILSLDFPSDDIAVLSINDPNKGANVLSRSVLDELEQHLDTLDARKGLAGMVIRSTKPGNFIAGADLREFVADIDQPAAEVIKVAQRGQKLFGRLSKASYVTVAAIDGLCVGGGAEFAIWCDRRVMARNGATSYAFPEVKLGLFPGWGGTVRTPRIVGLSNAVELVTGGEPIDAEAAMAMGLAEVAPPESLLDAAIAVVRSECETKQYLADRERWSAPIAISETELGFLGATASAYIQGQTKGHYPAPLAALEVLLGGACMDADSACEYEASEFVKLFGSTINRALLNVFFLTDRNKKPYAPQSGDAEVLEISSATVLGAGIMGQGIAAANAKRKIPVALGDISAAAGSMKVMPVSRNAPQIRNTETVTPIAST